jgi:hypothetical protein
MGRVRRQPLRAALACAAALAAVSACGPGVSTPAMPASAAASPGSPGGMVLTVLDGNGIDGASFGQARGAVTSRLDRLLGPPARPYSPSGACRVDHAIGWPGLHVLFHRGRFIGYSYSLADAPARAPVLATTAGLRYGDMLARGRQLYGPAFTWGEYQGGTWHVRTTQGLIAGFVSGLVSPRGHILTIEAGDVGCPAMSP